MYVVMRYHLLKQLEILLYNDEIGKAIRLWDEEDAHVRHEGALEVITKRVIGLPKHAAFPSG
jgi:hypothetical protein